MNHWSSTKIPSIWLWGLRVGPILSTGSYGAMSLFLLTSVMLCSDEVDRLLYVTTIDYDIILVF
jgi:hypothetical protein